MIEFKVEKVPKFNLKWWEPTQKEWAPLLLQDQKPFWRQESDPTTGRPWESLKPSYAKKKQQKFPGEPILRQTGTMQDEAVIRPWRDGFVVEAQFYGVYHQNGTRKMAARPWVGLPDVSMNRLPGISWKHILSQR